MKHGLCQDKTQFRLLGINLSIVFLTPLEKLAQSSVKGLKAFPYHQQVVHALEDPLKALISPDMNWLTLLFTG